MTKTLRITMRRPVSNTCTISIRNTSYGADGENRSKVTIKDRNNNISKSTNDSGYETKWLLLTTLSFIKYIVKMVVSGLTGITNGSILHNDPTRMTAGTDAKTSDPLRHTGDKSTSDHLPQKKERKTSSSGQGQQWKLPPTIYGNTANLGIFVDHSLLPILQAALKEPIAKKLFETAKKKGLASITVEPSLQYEAIPVQADEIRDTDKNESRIRIANATDPYAITLLVHELVHSATPENMNSKAEEYYAENIGRALYRRITGDMNLSMVPFTEIKKAYTSLPEDNHVRQDLIDILGFA